MPKRIELFEELIESKRFKKETNSRNYSSEELSKIKTLFNYIKNNDMNLMNGYYLTFCQLIRYDLNDLISRFKWITKNNKRRTKEGFIIRHGEKIGLEKWNDYCEKQRVKNLYETKKEKYGWTEEQFREFNLSRSITKELCIKRHGNEIGLQIWNNYIDRQRYTNTLEYYNEKFKDNGHKKWLEYNVEKSKAHSIDWIMKKYNVDESGACDILSNRYSRNFSSDSEMIFISAIEHALDRELQYTFKNKQFCIWNNELAAPCFYDIADSNIMKIIEFNGDYWHCNPVVYNESFLHTHSGLTAKEIWKKDYLKIQAAVDRGFNVKVVWESDFIKSPDIVVKEIIEWWNLK